MYELETLENGVYTALPINEDLFIDLKWMELVVSTKKGFNL